MSDQPAITTDKVQPTHVPAQGDNAPFSSTINATWGPPPLEGNHAGAPAQAGTARGSAAAAGNGAESFLPRPEPKVEIPGFPGADMHKSGKDDAMMTPPAKPDVPGIPPDAKTAVGDNSLGRSPTGIVRTKDKPDGPGDGPVLDPNRGLKGDAPVKSDNQGIDVNGGRGMDSKISQSPPVSPRDIGVEKQMQPGQLQPHVQLHREGTDTATAAGADSTRGKVGGYDPRIPDSGDSSARTGVGGISTPPDANAEARSAHNPPIGVEKQMPPGQLQPHVERHREGADPSLPRLTDSANGRAGHDGHIPDRWDTGHAAQSGTGSPWTPPSLELVDSGARPQPTGFSNPDIRRTDYPHF